MHILVIHNNELKGALNQSLGVVRSIGSYAEITVVSIRLRRRHLKRIAKLMCDWHAFRFIGPSSWLAPLWGLFYTASEQINGKPDLIVSHLGSTEHSSVSLSQYWDIPNIYIGTPRHYAASVFSMIVSGYETDKKNAPNVLSLETVPSHILPEDAENYGVGLRHELGMGYDRPIWCFLVGGDCAGYRYSTRDWDAVGDFMAACAEELGVSWLITTSRRTGFAAEIQMRSCLENAPWLLRASWHHTGEQRSLAELVGASSHCVVTEESLSMISDCVSLGRQVYTWGGACRHVSSLKCSNVIRIRKFLDKLEARKRIIRLPDLSISSINQFDVSCETVPVNQRWDSMVKKKARELEII